MYTSARPCTLLNASLHRRRLNPRPPGSPYIRHPQTTEVARCSAERAENLSCGGGSRLQRQRGIDKDVMGMRVIVEGRTELSPQSELSGAGDHPRPIHLKLMTPPSVGQN